VSPPSWNYEWKSWKPFLLSAEDSYRRYVEAYDKWIAMTVFQTTKDPDHSEMVTEHLKALDRSPTWNIFERPPKDTGVLHDVPSVAKALEKM
jgi:hypothetical protein